MDPPTPPAKNEAENERPDDATTIKKHLFDSPVALNISLPNAKIPKEEVETPVDVKRIANLTQPPTPPFKWYVHKPRGHNYRAFFYYI